MTSMTSHYDSVVRIHSNCDKKHCSVFSAVTYALFIIIFFFIIIVFIHYLKRPFRVFVFLVPSCSVFRSMFRIVFRIPFRVPYSVPCSVPFRVPFRSVF